MTNENQADDGRTEIKTPEDIDVGDEVTIESQGETLVDGAEINDIEVGGFAGEKTFKTDDEIDINASSLDSLLIDVWTDGTGTTAYIN